MPEHVRTLLRHGWALGAVALSLMGGTGCGDRQPQAASCEKFVACVQALDAQRGTQTNLVRFESDGKCWGSEEGAKLCGDSCTRGLVVMRERLAGLPGECAP